MPTLNFDVLWKDRGAERGMKSLGDTTERTGKRFSGLKVIGAAALAAVGVAAVKFGADSVKAYVDAESKQARLQEAYRKFPKLADTQITSLQKLNAELAKKTRFDDDATASGQAVLAQFNLTGKQITQLTPLLQDYAAKTGKDLPTAAKDLGKAVLGQGRALKNVGLDLKDTGTQTGNLDQLMKGLRGQVGGFAEKEGKTAAGQAEILKNQFGELQESAGAKLLPALMKVGSGLLAVVGYVQDSNGVFGSFKRITSETFGAFTESLGLGKASFQGFADFLSTHQADITSLFVAGGKVVIGFGLGLARMVSGGLRGFGAFSDGVDKVVVAFAGSAQAMLTVAAKAFGWIPGVGDKLKAAERPMADYMEKLRSGMGSGGRAANAMADKIDGTLVPALTSAGKKLDETARKEIVKQETRDAVNRAAIAVRDLGTKADGSQLKIKKFSDISRLSAEEQRGLKNRLYDTRAALQAKIEKMRAAGASSGDLRKEVGKSREALYKEFIQMGLSKEEARRLAGRYSQVPKKVETKVSTPGAQAARTNIKDLDNRINELNDKRVAISFATNASFKGFKVNLTAPSALGRLRAGGPVQNLTGRARRGVDTEPILGEVGEHMLTTADVDAMGGHRNVLDFRRALHMRAGGSVVRNLSAGADRVGSIGNLRGAVGQLDSGVNRWATQEGRRVGDIIRQKALTIMSASAGSGSWGGGSFGSLNASQMGIAATIASVGAGMGKKAQLIGIITGLVESGLVNVNYGDRDSLGVFQQRAPWGPASVRRDVRQSAGMFFHGGRGGQRGLDDISGWRGMSPGWAAQRVQVSAFPSRYGARVSQGLKILAALAGGGGAAVDTGGAGWMGGVRPLSSGRVSRHTSGYGWANYAGDFNGPGNDYGMPIRAWKSGTVTAANRWGYSYGNHLRIRHAGGSESLSAHASSLLARRGQHVSAGQTVARVGESGNAFGPHLHWEVKGLQSGGVVRGGRGGVLAHVGEGRRDELVAPLPRNWDRMVRGMDRGGGTTVNLTLSAPNYVGSEQELLNTLMRAAGQNRLQGVLRKAGVKV